MNESGESMDVRIRALEAEVAAAREEASNLRAERDVAAARARLLQLVIDGLPAAVAFMDRDFVYRVCNRVNAKFRGLSPEDFIGRTIADIFPGTAELLEGMGRQVVATGEELVLVAQPVRTVDERGTIDTHWDSRMVPLRDVDGTILGHVFLAFEVSDRVRLEQEVAHQRELLDRSLASVPAALIYADRDQVVRWASANALEMLGLAPDQLQGRSLVEVFPEHPQHGERLLQGILATGEAVRAEGMIWDRQVAGRPVRTVWDYVFEPVRGEDGLPQGVLLMGIEVSARVERDRLLHEQLERMQAIDRLKDRFLASLSHELRTPLHTILGFTGVIMDGLAEPVGPRQAGYLTKIRAAGEHLLGLINDLLDASRIQAGSFRLDPEPIELKSVVTGAVGGLEDLASGAGVRLEVDLEPALPAVVADPRRLGQVLLNLVGNSLKFSPRGATVRVVARTEATGVRIEVRDEGPGIAEKDLRRIFDPFTQLDVGATREHGGAGLGLAIVKALVEAHGGQVGVNSTPGAGSVFWFTLPREGPPPGGQGSSETAAAGQP